jgi:hypothetical protein
MSVTSWLIHHNAQLCARRPDDFRPLQPGTYCHRTLPYGPSRSGITNGDIVLLATANHGVVEVRYENLDVKLDRPTRAVRHKTAKPPRETRTSRLRALVDNISDLL